MFSLQLYFLFHIRWFCIRNTCVLTSFCPRPPAYDFIEWMDVCFCRFWGYLLCSFLDDFVFCVCSSQSYLTIFLFLRTPASAQASSSTCFLNGVFILYYYSCYRYFLCIGLVVDLFLSTYRLFFSYRIIFFGHGTCPQWDCGLHNVEGHSFKLWWMNQKLFSSFCYTPTHFFKIPISFLFWLVEIRFATFWITIFRIQITKNT